MKGALSFLLAVAMTIGAALVHGDYLNRWGEPHDLASAGASIDRLPRQFGAWRQISEAEPLTHFVSKELGLVNHFNRWFENVETGRRLQLLLMVGQPGPLVRHPPTVCYANRAHEQIAPPLELAVGQQGKTDSFRLLSYRPSRAREDEQFYVAYGHTIGAEWGAPDFPRIAYGNAPAMFKAQVLANRDGDEPPQEVIDDIESFLSVFVAEFSLDVLSSLSETPGETL